MTQDEFESFYDAHRRNWLAMMKHATRSEADAQDVLQSTVLWFLDGRLHTLDITKNPESWFRQKMYWIMKTKIFGLGGTKPSMWHMFVHLEDEHYHNIAGEPPPPKAPTPLERRVQEAVDNLTWLEMHLLTMAWFAGFPSAEIGKKLGLTTNAVNLRLSRLKKKLQRVLASDGISARSCGGNTSHGTTETAA